MCVCVSGCFCVCDFVSVCGCVFLCDFSTNQSINTQARYCSSSFFIRKPKRQHEKMSAPLTLCFAALVMQMDGLFIHNIKKYTFDNVLGCGILGDISKS